MTTIAANRNCMAADSKASNGELSYSTTKLFRKAGAIIGAAGEVGDCRLFINWYGTQDPKPELKEPSDFQALVLEKRGLFIYWGSFHPDPIKADYYAIGSGALGALVAMDCGLDPVRAVEKCCERDEMSGPPVDFLVLKSEKKEAKNVE